MDIAESESSGSFSTEPPIIHQVSQRRKHPNSGTGAFSLGVAAPLGANTSNSFGERLQQADLKANIVVEPINSRQIADTLTRRGGTRTVLGQTLGVMSGADLPSNDTSAELD